MDTRAKQVYNPDKEFFSFEGAPDPVTGRQGGAAPTYNLGASAIAHPKVRYRGKGSDRDVMLELDIQLDDNGTPYILMFCPRCQKTLTIHTGNKQFLHRPDKLVEVGGEISVEEFACTHDLDDGRKCGFRGVIERNILRRT